DTDNMPSSEIAASDFTNGEIGILDLLVKTKLAPSRAEAKRLVAQGGIAVDGEKVEQPGDVLTTANFEKQDKKYIVIKKGKKVFHKVILVG
ncbi:S4 domain-containing protein, partial [Mycobacteroides abscessus subsp. massiliense]|uniref:S4 domain-containing protein n=1 Tax=Mycobacteroides abscessus TaxID=36809 RepID=UPI003CEF09CC